MQTLVPQENRKAFGILTLHLDQILVEITRAFVDEGIKVILLKGPSIARRLYPDGTRIYSDLDLFVRLSQLTEAELVLRQLGFEPRRRPIVFGPEHSGMHAIGWVRRSDLSSIDVHTSIPLTDLHPEDVFDILERHTAPFQMKNGTVLALRDYAIALHIAIHAAQHHSSNVKVEEDLRRAVEAFDTSVWQEAKRLAEELCAIPPMVRGLSRLGSSFRLINQLGLHQVDTSNVPAPPDPFLRDFEWLAYRWRTASRSERLNLIGRFIFPRPSALRQISAVARRGQVGMGLAFATRPFLLGWRFVLAITKWGGRKVSES